MMYDRQFYNKNEKFVDSLPADLTHTMMKDFFLDRLLMQTHRSFSMDRDKKKPKAEESRA